MADSQSIYTLLLLQWLDIPGGQVILADNAGTFDVKPFKIAKYPATNEQFNAFIQADGYKNIGWWQGLTEIVKSPRASDWRDLDAPKLEVTWFEALAFTQWLSDQTSLKVRLPTEWEWQWAAVGDSGWEYLRYYI